MLQEYNIVIVNDSADKTKVLCWIKKDMLTTQRTEQGFCKNHIISINRHNQRHTYQHTPSSATIGNYSHYPYSQKYNIKFFPKFLFLFVKVVY